VRVKSSSDEHAGSSDSLDLLLCRATEELGLDDDRLTGQVTLAKYLVVARANDVDDGRDVGLGLVLCACLLRHKRPELVEVERGAPVLLHRLVEVAHAHLAKVPRVIFVKVDAVVMLTSGITSTTGVLAVFPNTAVAVAHVATHLPAFLQLRCTHFCQLFSKER